MFFELSMNAVVVSGIAIAFFLLALLLGKKNRLWVDRFLIIYLLFFIINHIYVYIELSGVLDRSPWMILGKGFYLLSAPLFFYYVYALIKGRHLSAILYIFTLLPFFLYLITFFYYYQQGFDQSIQIRNGLLYKNNQLSVIWTGFVFLFQLSDPLYIAWFFFLLKGYRNNINNSLSYTEPVNLRWLNVLFYIWIFCAVILVPFSLLSVGLQQIPITFPQMLLQLANVVFIFVAGYYGFRQTTVFSDYVIKSDEPKAGKSDGTTSYQRSGLTKEQAAIYHSQLVSFMEEKKPYLNGELSVLDLSGALGISSNHLSQILNQEQRQNFFDFVNGYRVREVQSKMADPRFSTYTLLGIAMESGFNSKTSFNTIFKKVTHLTPSQYYSSIKTDKKL